MTLFANKQESNLRSCVQMVEDALVILGHRPEDSRVPSQDGSSAWRVRCGAAFVHVYLFARPEHNHIRVVAPVLQLVSGVDELRLYRRLLELNCGEVTGAAFGLRENDVVLTSERSTTDLDPSEVLDTLKKTQDYANHFDDVLVSEFGGRLPGLSPPLPLK